MRYVFEAFSLLVVAFVTAYAFNYLKTPALAFLIPIGYILIRSILKKYMQ